MKSDLQDLVNEFSSEVEILEERTEMVSCIIIILPL